MRRQEYLVKWMDDERSVNVIDLIIINLDRTLYGSFALKH